MRSANVAEVKDRLSSFLRDVQKGEEVIITNRGQSIAKIIPYLMDDNLTEHERKLVLEGAMTLPTKKFDPVAFNKRKLPKSKASVVEALLEDREDRT
jgi:prevent-host-death family protein